MDRDEVNWHLQRAADDVAVMWAKARTAWIPNEVVEHIDLVVAYLLAEWDHHSPDAMETNKFTRERWFPPLEIREEEWRKFLVDRARSARHDVPRQVLLDQAANFELEHRKAAMRSVLGERARRAAEAAIQQQRSEQEVLEDRIAEKKARLEREAEARSARDRNRPAPKPNGQRYGVSPKGAELLAADWMRHLGVPDARTTRFSRDGGIDVESDSFVAQVKNYVGSVTVREVRELKGVASVMRKDALLFTSGSFTRDAVTFAENSAVALLKYDVLSGGLLGANQIGEICVLNGIPEAFRSLRA